MTIDDSGYLMVMDADGNNLAQYQLTASGYSDMEGIAIANASDPDGTFYTVVESPPAILEFKFSQLSSVSNNSANRVFTIDIPDVNAAAANQRLEGLAFVPWSAFLNNQPSWLNGQPEPDLKGIFYIALQSNGCAYAVTPGVSPSTSLTYYNGKASVFCSGNSDLAALSFDSCHEVLYGANDGADLLRQFTPQGQVLNSWSLAGTEQEGIGLSPGLQILMAQDVGQICRFGFNPFNATLPDRCDNCGNGHIDSPEGCDDGNFASGDGCENDCTLSPTAVPTPTPSATPSPTSTPTASATPSPTSTPTPSATNTPTPTTTASPSATPAPTTPPSPSISPTDSPTPTLSATPTAIGTVAETATPVASPSPTQEPQRCQTINKFLPLRPSLREKKQSLHITIPRPKLGGVSYEVVINTPRSKVVVPLTGRNYKLQMIYAGKYRIRYRLLCAARKSKLSSESSFTRRKLR